ncbi:hybrid sensor histidine kinase/response regulator [Fulvitalea axinellae]|uniref:histidine kinase n=2 Tax=Fulvitalea axinellae TaxID=1182444 RepID=A0AAU9D0E7_9BACT|nr:hybrid sensor histidine kinase/response regulator [Fulvitalea axinellae]
MENAFKKKRKLKRVPVSTAIKGRILLVKNRHIVIQNEKNATVFTFDKNGERFALIEGPNGKPIKNANSILRLKNGKTLIGTSKGAYLISDSTITKILSDQSIQFLSESGDGNIWFWLGEKKLICVSAIWEKIAEFPLDIFHKNILTNRIKIASINSSEALLASRDSGVYSLNFKSGKATQLTFNSLKASYNLDLINDNKGRIWLGTDGEGAFLFNKKEHTWTKVSAKLPKAIYDIYEDQAGNVLFGTNFGGVFLYKENFGPFDNPKKGNRRITDSRVLSICVDRNGQKWIGTDGFGIRKITESGETNTATPFLDLTGQKGFIQNIYESRKGNIWLSTYQQGIGLLDTTSLRIKKRFSFPRNIRSIAEDSTGNFLWLGTENGLFKMNKLNGKSERIRFQNDKQFGYKIPIKTILTDEKNRLWVGSEFRGLFRLTFSQDSITECIETSTVTFVRHLYNDLNGYLWITGKTNLFKIPIDNIPPEGKRKMYRFPHDKLKASFLDHNGELWISTERGLIKMDTLSGKAKRYSTYHGLQSLKFTRNAGDKTENGKIIFGGVLGLNEFHPDSLASNAVLPTISIEGMKVDGVSIFKNPAYKNTSLGDSTEYSLPFDYKSLSFEHSIPSLQRGGIFVEQRLIGLDSSWTETSKYDKITYGRLPPGTYKFQIRSTLNSEEISQIIFRINRPWWLSFWAFCLYTIAVGTIVYALHIYFSLKRKVKFEKIHNKRLNELSQLKLRFFTNISHELRTPLTLILGPVKRMANTEKDENKKQQLSVVERNADILLQTINELLDFNKIEAEKFSISAKRYKFDLLINNITQLFSEIAKSKSIDFRFENKIQTHTEFVCDKNVIEKVAINLISNAFKYTPDYGRITVSVYAQNGNMVLTVEDNGKGIKSDKLPHIFESFYQANHADSLLGSGIGLTFVKKLVEIHGGKISVQSELGLGTTFTVRFSALAIQTPEEKDPISITPTKHLFQGKNNEAEHFSISGKKQIMLVIDDNREIREFISSIFAESFDSVHAENGQEGFDLALKHNPDIIISDIMMPVLNGIGLCSKLKSNPITSHIPLIFLTAKTDNLSEIEGFKIGADGYIPKPFDENKLITVVSSVLTNRALLKKRYSHLTAQPNSTDSTEREKNDERFISLLTEQIFNLMDENNLTVENLTKEMAMSHSVLFKKCKYLTGMSLSKFIQKQRILRAATLLRKSGLTIKATMQKVGINDPKHFRDCFFKEIGMLPSEWKKG